jgi:hypothetical protein
MKILITGHTSGLGKRLYDRLSLEHEVHGMSRTNGYDLTKDYQSVLEFAKTCDVFINNAHVNTIQSDFLNDMVGSDVTVITSGSIAADRTFNDYCFQKKHVEDTFDKSVERYRSRGLFLKMGYLENKLDYATKGDMKFKVIEIDEVVDTVIFWLSHRRITKIIFNNIILDV